MQCLSRTLERVRAALFGRRTPGRHSTDYEPPAAPQAPRRRPTPDVWGARLVTVRTTHRDRHAQGEAWQPQPQERAEWFPPADWEHTGALVRPFVLSPEERQLALSAWKFTKASR